MTGSWRPTKRLARPDVLKRRVREYVSAQRQPLDLSVPPPEMQVYFIQHDEGGPIKIGTALGPESRLANLQSGNPFPLYLRLKLQGGKEEERALHKHFKHIRMSGEWFRATPALLQFIWMPPADLRSFLGLAPPEHAPSAAHLTLREAQATAQQARLNREQQFAALVRKWATDEPRSQ